MVEAKEIAERYPEPCPFCSISAAYPPHTTASSASAGEQKPDRELLDCIPSSAAVEPARVDPAAFIVLSAPRVMAFLDILPMTRGHLLVTTREHRGKVQDVEGLEGRDVGELSHFCLLSSGIALCGGLTNHPMCWRGALQN